MTDLGPYPEYVARFYDVIYAHLRTVDRDFFLKEILTAKGPVLEVGVGTGRFFLDALNQGADVYGIDVSAAMLEQLRAKLDNSHHRRVFQQDVRSLNLEMKFDLVVAPFRVFSHLMDIEDQLLALNSIYDHLNPGGRFIFDLYVPDLKILQSGINGETDFDGEYAPGKRLKRVVSAESDLISQVTKVTMNLTWDEEGGQKTLSWHLLMRFFFRFELEHLIARSKLKLERICGDYEKHDLISESKDFIIVCKRGE
jgi:SAM-dependent methyltransferase